MKVQEITNDIFFATIADLNARLKKREFSAVELVRAFGHRLETLGPRYNALVTERVLTGTPAISVPIVRVRSAE